MLTAEVFFPVDGKTESGNIDRRIIECLYQTVDGGSLDEWFIALHIDHDICRKGNMDAVAAQRSVPDTRSPVMTA